MWRDLRRVHRLEYPFPVRYLCYACCGAAYAAGTARQLAGPPVLTAITISFVLIIALNALNAAADVRTDALAGDKGRVASAVLRIGRDRVVLLAGAEMAWALAMAVAVSLRTQHWLTAAAAAATVAVNLLYNLEPVRLKRRPLANPVALGLSVGLLPCLVSAGAVQPDPAWSAWPIFLGLGLLVTGRASWWSIPDRASDAATGMTTPAVRFGAAPTLVAASVLAATGLGLLGWGLVRQYGLAWALLGVAVSAVFPVDALALLRRSAADRLASSVAMRRRGASLVMVADTILVAIPLIANQP
ncbi:hypothetical protein GTS_13290 [Gandjariella thermophila]|uniref:4-hydroxybenzoate polyprenyltransferase n=2 Tax=Gandjariella thermophila TaxID=1931992 RepID=A0A4D4J577_9PSEU|nr:hypothetical protein GTS_13290 [Gandjariella thermophila]